jgi:hypothetical protein
MDRYPPLAATPPRYRADKLEVMPDGKRMRGGYGWFPREFIREYSPATLQIPRSDHHPYAAQRCCGWPKYGDRKPSPPRSSRRLVPHTRTPTQHAFGPRLGLSTFARRATRRDTAVVHNTSCGSTLRILHQRRGTGDEHNGTAKNALKQWFPARCHCHRLLKPRQSNCQLSMSTACSSVR